jgi:hypothetical protein
MTGPSMTSATSRSALHGRRHERRFARRGGAVIAASERPIHAEAARMALALKRASEHSRAHAMFVWSRRRLRADKHARRPAECPQVCSRMLWRSDAAGATPRHQVRRFSCWLSSVCAGDRSDQLPVPEAPATGRRASLEAASAGCNGRWPASPAIVERARPSARRLFWP